MHDLTEITKDTGVIRRSSRLEGARVGFGVCGGIGSVEVVKIMRELRRHGAEVTPFLTPSVARFITPLSLAWAAGKDAVTEASWEVDHLQGFDVVVTAPATLNTLAKVASGIADNAVTLLLAAQIGNKKPVVLFSAMNLVLKNHPAYTKHKEVLETWGVHVVEPPVEEGRLKMPSPDFVFEWVEKLCRQQT